MLASINKSSQYSQDAFDDAWYRADWNDDGVIDQEETKSLIKGALDRVNRLNDDNNSYDSDE